MKAKCQPGGTSLIPRNCGDVVNERRSYPQRIEGGMSRNSNVGVYAGLDDCVIAIMDI